MQKKKYNQYSDIKMKKAIIKALTATALTLTATSFLIFSGQKQITLVDKGLAIPIVVDASEEPVVDIAAKMFAGDVEQISGILPQIHSSYKGGPAIIAGTFGKSKILDEYLRRSGLDLSALKGKWEAFHIEISGKGQDRVLVVAGSDRRGTAYGILEVSRMLGVSPWVWWADVLPERQEQVVLNLKQPRTDAPDVAYRGIFLNDEDWGLKPWAEKNFEPEVGDPGPKTYSKIFELLLRLRANTIWPAMHEVTKSFHTIEGNRAAADSFAIVISTSHCEQMLRTNTGEWDARTMGSYNYKTNRQTMYQYWEGRVKETTTSENIYTLGLRGVHDGKMEGANTVAEQTVLLRQAVDDQREMLDRHFTKPLAEIPQIFIPYKEVLEVYDAGFEVPQDVTLIWCDDNYGFIRRLSNEQERKRPGGAGVYYHVSYWGRPHDYLWISSTQPALVWFEMRKAWDYGARKQWILNVGDIKPAEYLIEMFMDMAWDVEAFQAGNIPQHLARWSERTFGQQSGPEIARMLQQYFDLGFIRRPEFMGWSQTEPTTPTRETELNPYEFNNEAELRVETYRQIEQQSIETGRNIPEHLRDAYFQLVEYPVRGASLMNRKWIYAQLASQYSSAGVKSAAEYGAESLKAYDEISALTLKYNQEIAGGKWKEMMSMAPRRLPVFDRPVIRSGQASGVSGASGASGSQAGSELKTYLRTEPNTIQTPERRANREQDQCVVLSPTNSQKSTDGKNQWLTVDGLGQSKQTRVVYPFLTSLSAQPKENPCLEYTFSCTSTGEATLYVAMLPTHPVDGKGDVRYALSLDGKEPQIISFRTYDRDNQWKANVLRNQALTKSVQTIDRPGTHTLRIYAMDPGTALDQVMLDFKKDRKFYIIPEAKD